jgi:hypothetical protein
MKYRPYAFTEQGVAMLASVLSSDRAVQASIAVVRVFVRLRGMLATHQDLANRLADLEQRFEKHDAEIHEVFTAIRELMTPPAALPKRRIGFNARQTAIATSHRRLPG